MNSIAQVSERQARVLRAAIPGYYFAPNGVLCPTPENLKHTLDSYKVAPDPPIPFVSNRKAQGKKHTEFEWALDALETGMGMLLSGPTGTGKSMFASYVAQRLQLPLVLVGAHPDQTEDVLIGSEAPLFATLDSDGHTNGNGGMSLFQTYQQFRPGPSAIIALSESPGILFVDELHKLRIDTDTFLHHMLQERVILLGDHLGPGQQVKLHPKTLIMFALNPDYGHGLNAVGVALRQRCIALRFEIPHRLSDIMELIEANLHEKPSTSGSGILSENEFNGQLPRTFFSMNYKRHKEDAERLAKAASMLSTVFLASKARTEALKGDQLKLQSALSMDGGKDAVTNYMAEAPSPRIILSAVMSVCRGMDWLEAFEVKVMEPILTREATVPVRNAIIETVMKSIA